MEHINNNEMESMPIIDEEIIQNTEEENDFLKSLDDEEKIEAGFDQQAEQALLLAQGEMTAVALLGAGEGLIKNFGHKDFKLDPAQKENASKSFAPLFVKHGGELPPWVTQYKEEIMFTFALGSMCFASYAQVKTLKQQDAEEANKKKKEGVKQDATNQPE